MLQVALIENIQRENLNPIDEATAYKRLIDEFNLTQEDLATAVGKDRSTVANTMRLLKLPESVQLHVAAGDLSMGHARAILALEREEDQNRHGPPGRPAGILGPRHRTAGEARRRKDGRRRDSEKPKPRAGAIRVDARQAEDRMKFALGTRVKSDGAAAKASDEIESTSGDELQRMYEVLVAA